MFEQIGPEAAESIDSMKMSVSELNEVYKNLLGDEEDQAERFEQLLKDVEAMDYSGLTSEEEAAAKRRNLLIAAVEQNRAIAQQYSEIANMTTEQLQAQVAAGNQLAIEYSNALQKQAELEDKLDEETKKLNEMEQGSDESDEDYAKRVEEQTQKANEISQELNGVTDTVNKFENATEDADKATEEMIDTLLSITDSTAIVDSITSLTSTMERLSKISDITSLSFEEQAELLKDYPELIGAMEKGYLSSADAMDLYSKKLDDLMFDAKRTKEDIQAGANTALQLDGKTLNGFNMATLFEDTDAAAEMRENLINMDKDDLYD